MPDNTELDTSFSALRDTLSESNWEDIRDFPESVCLDGHYTLADLRKIVAWMEENGFDG